MLSKHARISYFVALIVSLGADFTLSLSEDHQSHRSSVGFSFARRSFLLTALSTRVLPLTASADDNPALTKAPSEANKLFQEGRALESQGNLAAAQKIYQKVTQLVPRFVYGWSNLGNTQTAFGDLDAAEISYTTAINLCQESLPGDEQQQRCSDLYILFLNRGSLRLNNNMEKEALNDLQQSVALRGRPDAIVLQNLARAEELNGLYKSADRDYSVAISMTANEVQPFWLRSAMTKFQLGDIQDGLDLLKRVQNRFPEAPEV
jgi:tetratricopeptide (TPR) repeat protein